MHTIKNPCFLNWRWSVLCRNYVPCCNEEFFSIVLGGGQQFGGAGYVEDTGGEAACGGLDRSWCPAGAGPGRGAKQKRLSLCGWFEGRDFDHKPVRLHFREAVVEQH